MTMNRTFIVVFCSSYETRVKHNDKRPSSLSSVFFPWIVEDNDKPPHLSSSFATKEKNKKNTETHKRMTSLPHRPLH